MNFILWWRINGGPYQDRTGPSGLQSPRAPNNTYSPFILDILPKKYGAGGRIRTRDPLITNQVLYRLSYSSVKLYTAFFARGLRAGFSTTATVPCSADGTALG